MTTPNWEAQERKDRKGNKLRGARGLRVSLLPAGCPHHGPGWENNPLVSGPVHCFALPAPPPCSFWPASLAPQLLHGVANLIPRSLPSLSLFPSVVNTGWDLRRSQLGRRGRGRPNSKLQGVNQTAVFLGLPDWPCNPFQSGSLKLPY